MFAFYTQEWIATIDSLLLVINLKKINLIERESYVANPSLTITLFVHGLKLFNTFYCFKCVIFFSWLVVLFLMFYSI